MSNEITQEQLTGWIREIDTQLPVPEYPEDNTTPIDFGLFGVVVMSDNVPMLISVGDDPWAMLESDEVRVFAQGFGSFFMVSYGVAIQKDLDQDTEEQHIARCIFGVSHNGVRSALMRFLDSDEIQVDEEGNGTGEAHEAMMAVWA